MTKPDLKEWRELLQADLEAASNKQADLQEILSICENYYNEMQSVIRWISDQAAFIEGIKREYTNLYHIRFGDAPPLPTKASMPSEKLLSTPQERKKAVQELALEISKPGSEINDKTVLEELTRRSIKLVAGNPTAVISTILGGFTSEFEKVKGQRGTFKRKIQKIP
jgi:hypothetical protein